MDSRATQGLSAAKPRENLESVNGVQLRGRRLTVAELAGGRETFALAWGANIYSRCHLLLSTHCFVLHADGFEGGEGALQCCLTSTQARSR
jgi:hypothetical protein